MTPNQPLTRIELEEACLRTIMALYIKDPEPERWPVSCKKILAQAFIAPDGRLDPEHAKGLRLMALFYPGKSTVLRAPVWVRNMLAYKTRTNEHLAERVRADLAKLIHRHKDGRRVWPTT